MQSIDVVVEVAAQRDVGSANDTIEQESSRTDMIVWFWLTTKTTATVVSAKILIQEERRWREMRDLETLQMETTRRDVRYCMNIVMIVYHPLCPTPAPKDAPLLRIVDCWMKQAGKCKTFVHERDKVSE